LEAAFAAAEHLEVFERDGIDEQTFRGRLVGDRTHVGEVGLLRLAKVGDQPAGRLDRGDAATKTETVQTVCL
jgi:hypothetical protein